MRMAASGWRTRMPRVEFRQRDPDVPLQSATSLAVETFVESCAEGLAQNAQNLIEQPRQAARAVQ